MPGIAARRDQGLDRLKVRFDKQGALWTPEDLEKQLGGYFADRDPSIGFAADSIMKLSAR